MWQCDLIIEKSNTTSSQANLAVCLMMMCGAFQNNGWPCVRIHQTKTHGGDASDHAAAYMCQQKYRTPWDLYLNLIKKSTFTI